MRNQKKNKDFALCTGPVRRATAPRMGSSGYGLRITHYAFLLFLLLASHALPAPPLERGKVSVCYYHCDLDDTDQPYSLWLPKDYAPEKKWPLVIQLHGLGGGHHIGGVAREIEDCVVAAPDGRGNTDYKLWGELDVMRVVDEVKKHYSIDPDRVYLFGISMGGSGSWQLGVHFPDTFAALGPVCGNADHRVWEKLWNWGEVHPTWMSPKKAWVEATESPAFFAENLIHLPSWPIHGDKDNVVPCDHSRSMAAELKKAGAECHFVEVPGAGHGVPGEKVAEMLKWLKEQRRDLSPKRVVFKTAWRRHPGAYWVRVHRFLRPFAFARIEAEATDKTAIQVKTENLEEFSLHLVAPLVEAGKSVRVTVNGRQDYAGPVAPDGWLRLRLQGGKWQPSEEPKTLHKTPELEGPVQHAFMTPFVIVFGTQGNDERAKRVSSDEARILADRWNRWSRGRCRMKADRDVTPEDIKAYNLVLVGDPAVNSLIPRVMAGLPIRIEGEELVLADRRLKGSDLGLKLVYPNPLNPKRYVALFSGTTWRGVFQIVGRFGNWFDWGILDGWHWSDFAVFDDHTYSPETFLAIGYFDNDWKLNPDWTVRGDEKMRLARPPRKTPSLDAPPEGVGEFYLSDLQPAYANIEKGAVGRDRSFSAFPLTLGTRTYARGLGIHPNCDIGFDLGGRFPTFEAVVGSDLEDEKTVSEARDKAESFEFLVVGDGRTLYSTGRMRWDSEPRHIYVPIAGVRRLDLKMQRRSGPRWLSGPADWAIARVGEPLHNSVAVRAAVEGPKPLVEARPLDGPWKLASFPVGEGIDAQAQRGSPEALKDAIPAAVPGSVYAALDAAGNDEAALRDAAGKEWWLWREVEVPREWAGRSIWVELDGAAYQADCWLNGRWIGRTVGPFVQGRFDATQGARLGGKNTVAIRVTSSPADWAKGASPFQPLPASKLVTSCGLARAGYPPLGVWQPVRIKAAGPCLLRGLNVQTVEIGPEAAGLRIEAELASLVPEKLAVTLSGTIEGGDKPLPFEKKLDLDGNATAIAELDLDLPQPKLWWPKELGGQPLYRLAASVKLASGAVSDQAERRFGIRTIELDPSSRVARLRVNGHKTLDLFGCVWQPADALLRLDAARYERLLGHARECGFNALRVWGGGLVETGLFYDLCDRLGFLVLQELPLTTDRQEAPAEDYLANCAASLRRVRTHPSLLAWCVGGAEGGSPDPRLTAEAAALCTQLDPQRGILGDSPATGLAQLWTTRADPAARRVYWRGASLRYVPGVAAPSLAFAQAADDAPRPPSGGSAAYGPARSPREQVMKAQTAQAAALQRAVERHRLAPSGEVLWQLNEPAASSSPALIDATGVPRPACRFLRRAMGDAVILADFGGGVSPPTTLALNERLRGEVCVQSRLAPLAGALATATILDRSMRRLVRWESRFDAPQGVLARPLVFDWSPEPSLAGDVCFLHLRLDDAKGRPLSSNLYWLGVVAPKAKAARPLRVGWLTGRPRGPLADEAFLAATGIEVKRPEARPVAPDDPGDIEAPAESKLQLDGYDLFVVDAATVFTDFTDSDLKAVAAAVEKGGGLLVEGIDETLFDSSLAPLMPIGYPASVPTGMSRQPVAKAADHPALRGIRLDGAPVLARREPVEVKPGGEAIVQLDAEHPLLAERRHGEGRVMALATRPGGELAGWDEFARFYAGVLGYLGRLPHRELGELIEAAQPAPLQALDRLGPATIEAKARQDGDAVAVQLTNVSTALAFMVSLTASGAPVAFSDNDFCLLPGESTQIRLVGGPGQAAAASAEVLVGGWNVESRPLPGRIEVQNGRTRFRSR